MKIIPAVFYSIAYSGACRIELLKVVLPVTWFIDSLYLIFLVSILVCY